MTTPPSRPEPAGIVSDAVDGNWVDRFAPLRLRPYLRLSRADRPIGTWLLLLPCWWGLFLSMATDSKAGLFDVWIFVGCAAGAFLMRGAGCTWNDITDREFDAKVARTASRPIPSGQVSPRSAMIWMIVQAALAFLILLSLPLNAIYLGILALVPVAIYPFAKRFTWWPQIFLGIAFNWGALLAWTAHSGSLGLPAVILYLGGMIWTLFYDTIYAHQDTEDDALIGVKSTARLFGQTSPRWLWGFLTGTTMLLAIAVFAALPPGPARWLALLGPVALALQMMWQMRRLDINNPALCMRLFRSNSTGGLWVTLFFAGAALLSQVT